MQVYVVFHYYNARTDNSIIGVFVSKEKAVKCVKDRIIEDKKMAKQCGRKVKWAKPYTLGSYEIVYEQEDSEESYEITTHTLIE